MKMHHGDDEKSVFLNLINDSLGEPVCPTATGSLGKLCPSLREFDNTPNRSPHFIGKLNAQPFAVGVIRPDGFNGFYPGRLQELNIHLFFLGVS